MLLNSEMVNIRTVRYLDENGMKQSDVESVSANDVLGMYKWMIQSRVFDERAMKYQRQGRIGTYAPFKGQEAAQIGSAYALEGNDWIYPSYREVASSLVRGMPMSQFFLYAMGDLKGQDQTGLNIFPVQIIIAAQCLHAVGGAWASKYKGEKSISVAYVGDGGTSEGDFHEALNFAGVFKLPVIFFVQNNQWAISVPISKQTASDSIAQKAIAYGIDGIQVDGNDVIAVYLTMKEAVKRAREGKPTLIEAITYRQGPHTTADDPSKYRNVQEEAEWKVKDPLERVKKYLIANEQWNENLDEKEYEQAEEKVTQAFETAVNMPKSKIVDIFNNVYEEKTILMQEQQALFSKGE